MNSSSCEECEDTLEKNYGKNKIQMRIKYMFGLGQMCFQRFLSLIIYLKDKGSEREKERAFRTNVFSKIYLCKRQSKRERERERYLLSTLRFPT